MVQPKVDALVVVTVVVAVVVVVVVVVVDPVAAVLVVVVVTVRCITLALLTRARGAFPARRPRGAVRPSRRSTSGLAARGAEQVYMYIENFVSGHPDSRLHKCGRILSTA
eukprot:COSAG06_NODE_22159_length_732_cov_1.036335_1_plen_109_part_01